MGEYIKKSDIKYSKQRIEAWFGCQPDNYYALVAFKTQIDDIPAADVRPVVKAKWVYTDRSRLVCSNCGNPVAFALKDDGWYHGDFCPNCGADMRQCPEDEAADEMASVRWWPRREES